MALIIKKKLYKFDFFFFILIFKDKTFVSMSCVYVTPLKVLQSLPSLSVYGIHSMDIIFEKKF